MTDGTEALFENADRLRGFAELLDDAAKRSAADPDRFPNQAVTLSQRSARLAADDLVALLDALARVDLAFRIMATGLESRPDEVLSPNERLARHGQDTVLEIIREAITGVEERRGDV